MHRQAEITVKATEGIETKVEMSVKGKHVERVKGTLGKKRIVRRLAQSFITPAAT
jgi:hypothetical protein